MSGSVIPCVGAVVTDRRGRLLMIKRGHEPGAGLWSIPGGRIEPGETDTEALVREMFEETGLAVEVGRLIGRVQRPGPNGTVIDIRDYTGKSENSLARVRGRIIGLHGKSRRVIEELTKCDVSVYGKTVAIIGEPTELRLAKDAIEKLAAGSQHKSVYNMLQRARTKCACESPDP